MEINQKESKLYGRKSLTVSFQQTREESSEEEGSSESVKKSGDEIGKIYESNDRQSHQYDSEIISDESLRLPVGFYANPLDEFSDDELMDLVSDTEKDLELMNLENFILRDFLQKNDPSLLEKFEEVLDYAKGEGPPPADVEQKLSARNLTKLSRSLSTLTTDRGPKVNLSQKIDMVTRATEEQQSKFDEFVKKFEKTRRKVRAELEEFRMSESEIREARDVFEFNVVTQGMDKLTQRIPAEKFLRYMDEWLKTATAKIEKLRLRTASLKVFYRKVSQTLLQRKELGENVHPVDFDQLIIENRNFVKKIEHKNVHLVELKKMNGAANLILSTHKKFLNKQQQDYEKLKRVLDEHGKLMTDLENECDQVRTESERAKARLETIKNLKKSYTVPDVAEYIELKRELSELRKTVKVWNRRKKIQDISLNTCIRHMMNVTGRMDVDPSWFVDTESRKGSVP